MSRRARRDCLRCFALGLGTGAVFVWYAHIAGYRAGIKRGKLYAESPLDVVDTRSCGAELETAWVGGILGAREMFPVRCKKRDGHEPPHESEVGHLWR